MENKKAVGIWIRVSTEDQAKGESPEHHEKRARLYAEAKGWDVVVVYHLEAISGKSVINHPEAKKMLKDIKEGHITGLIFSKLARLARNTRELLDFADIFRDSGADLVSLQESIDTSTPAGRLFYTMIAAMAQWEREEIAERVAASVPIRAKLGKPIGGQASFGYQWEPEDPKKENSPKKLVINETEAVIRKLMYELFAEHKRKKTVARILNEKGYRTRKGSPFTDTTIDRLLRDSTAKGQRIANYSKSLGDSKKWVYKPKEEWIITKCPAIVSEELWDECNRILDEQEKKRKKPGPKAVHLLSGYVTCHCSKKMYVFHKAPVYVCKNCKNRIAVSDLDEIYHEQLKSFLLTETDMNEYLQKSNSVLQEKTKLLEMATDESKKIKKKMDELLEMRLNGELNRDTFPSLYRPFEERYIQMEAQLPELQAEIDFLQIEYFSSDTIFQEATDLYNNWLNLPFEQKRTIVETITDSIVIGKEDINIHLAYFPSLTKNSGKRQRNLIPALPFSRSRKFLEKPISGYPKEIKSIGDHIRAKRLVLNLLQEEAARLLEVCTDTVTGWEAGRSKPKICHYPKIIQFLGYNPFTYDPTTLKGKILGYRQSRGLSQKKLGEILGCDGSTIASWEKGEREPHPKILERLNELLSAIF